MTVGQATFLRVGPCDVGVAKDSAPPQLLGSSLGPLAAAVPTPPPPPQSSSVPPQSAATAALHLHERVPVGLRFTPPPSPHA
uniref:Uncharacterized protein n=1 Tax=Oryza sativa subsp. japonica TaxID=39947 RepID=Q6YS34_ORYSJ|nr:hypothetical protein [Oryza sativa Japonica Group]BAD31991.1 hypothetical protein [Oryza sativa Japonica Group]